MLSLIAMCTTVESYCKDLVIVKYIVKNISSFSRIKLINLSVNPFFSLARFWKTIASTLCKVDSTLFQCWTPTLYQCCATLKIQLNIFFHFQRRSIVISTAIHNIETTLIRRWNVGWVVSMKTLILRNILLATLLTNWHL